MDFTIGDRVIFGRPSGEQTIGRVTKVNPKTVKVAIETARGSRSVQGAVWKVHKTCARLVDESGIEAPPRRKTVVEVMEAVCEECGVYESAALARKLEAELIKERLL